MFPDLASVAAAMREAKVVVLEAGGVKIVLHPSAFAQPEAPGQDYSKLLADAPTDDELQFWSVEGPPERKP